MKNNKKRNLLLSLILAAVCIAFLLYVDKFQHYSMLATVLKKGAIYSLVAVSLNLLNGFTGLFSLGQAGFMLLGAYTYAILMVPMAVKDQVYYLFDSSAVKFSLLDMFQSIFGAAGFGSGVALVLAVLLNLLVRAIPAKYTEFDLSEAKMYTLSDSTKALVEGLEKDVHIYYLCETGSEDAIITKLLDHYAAESGHLSWEQKDPTLYPTFAAKYGAENVSTGSLIVTCGENSTVLDAADLYEYDYTDYYTTGSASVTFGG